MEGAGPSRAQTTWTPVSEDASWATQQFQVNSEATTLNNRVPSNHEALEALDIMKLWSPQPCPDPARHSHTQPLILYTLQQLGETRRNLNNVDE